MTAFNPVQKNAFFATKHLLTLMGVNIRAKALTDLLVSSRDFPSLASIVETLEMLKIKNLPVYLKQEQLEEIPLPAIAQLTIDGDIFVPVRKIDNQVIEWCHEKKGWQCEPLTEFNKKWNGILLLVDDDSAFYAKKEFSNKPNFFVEYASIILCLSAFVCIAYFLGFLDRLFSQNWQTQFFFITNLFGFIALFSVSLWKKIDEYIPLIRQESKVFRNNLIDIEAIGFYYFFSVTFSILIGTPKCFSTLSSIIAIFSIGILVLVFRYFYSTEKKLKWLLLGCSLVNLIICYWVIGFSNFEDLFNSILVFLFALLTAHILFWLFRKFKITELNNKKLLGITQSFKNNKTLLSDFMASNKLLPPIFKDMVVIEFGDETATHTVILAGDPSEKVFSNYYFELKELVKRNEAIKMQIILFQLNYNRSKVSKFIEILLSLNRNVQLSELEMFLNLRGGNLQKWLDKHFNIEVTEQAKKVYSLYRSWADISEKRHFPILALNGIEIPFLYRIDDIEFILETMESNN